jgi:CMP-N,N'-diacetyllegionaminic acid synthase
MPPTVLGVVTARAGSKGLPGKNTRLLHGRPLISYTIAAAHESAAFERLMISTDDAEAAAIATAAGCEVPFMRPAELAADDTAHLPVMQHALKWMSDRADYHPDWTMILMPTSPLRQPRHIVQAIELAQRLDADSVVSVDALPLHHHPQRALTIDAQGWARLLVGNRPVRQRPARRQDLEPAWVFNGAIYLFRTALLFAAEPSLYGDRVAAYAMDPPHGLNIDDAADWAAAEQWLASTPAR